MQGCAAENLRRSLFVCVKIMAPPVADILVLSPATVPAPNPGAVFLPHLLRHIFCSFCRSVAASRQNFVFLQKFFHACVLRVRAYTIIEIKYHFMLNSHMQHLIIMSFSSVFQKIFTTAYAKKRRVSMVLLK